MSDKQLPDGFEWPRFEDGEDVKPGNWAYLNDAGSAVKIDEVGFTKIGGKPYACLHFDEEMRLVTEPIPRPPVLDKDGQEIKVCDIVYDEDGKEWDVLGLRWHEDPYVVEAEHEGEIKQLKPEWLTHERPDSWERPEEDARKGTYDYWQCADNRCGDCPAIVGGKNPAQRCHVKSCATAMLMEIVARAEKLAGVMGDV